MNKSRFQQLIDKYLCGAASEEEEKQLQSFFNSFQVSEHWDEKELGAKSDLEEKMLNRLLAEVAGGKKREKSPVRFIWSWKSAAAAVILLVGLAGLFYLPSKEPAAVAESSRFKNDISPGGEKAVLTLADGTLITLDNKEVGLLAEQGSTAIKKTEEGEIVYSTASGAAASAGFNTIATPHGGQFRIVLPDGTKVWLNSGSSLKYPTTFTGTRRVELAGEAYFEVTSLKGQTSEKIPFIVATASQEVKVLGTQFNIQAYQDENDAKTTLLEGSVQVSKQPLSSSTVSHQASKVLKPRQQALITGGAAEIEIMNDVETEAVVAWKDGLFVFNNTKIESAMQQISRWYDAEIVYDGPHPNVELTGVIPRKDNLIKILKVLESAGGVKFGVEGKRIVIRKA